jgi:AcrR family transcriptional regulator
VSLTESAKSERELRKRQAFIGREQDILSVSESLMADKGVRKVSVDSIAVRTGIGKGTIYKHFDSKRDLLIAIAERHYGTLSELLGLSTDPAQALSDWIEARLSGARQSMLIQELTETLADDSGALSKIQESQSRMRKRLAQVLSGSSTTRGESMERAIWLESLVQGALVEMESPLKSESFDVDEWIESITRIASVLLNQPKRPEKDQRLTYL